MMNTLEQPTRLEFKLPFATELAQILLNYWCEKLYIQNAEGIRLLARTFQGAYGCIFSLYFADQNTGEVVVVPFVQPGVKFRVVGIYWLKTCNLVPFFTAVR